MLADLQFLVFVCLFVWFFFWLLQGVLMTEQQCAISKCGTKKL
jgi:hypothetical protein